MSNNQDILNLTPPTDRRWSWLEVDLDAIRHNISKVKMKIGQYCKLMVVVKADAYGHGAVQVAKTASNCGANYLGVATIDEAVQIRQAGIDTNILVLSQPPMSSIPLLLEFNVYPSIYSGEFAIQYAEEADKLGKLAPFHLAVNTGMNRIGVEFDQALDFIKSISFHRALKMEGVFTHFATSDMADTKDFQRQYSNFVYMLDLFKQNNIETGLVHAANSAAIFRFPETHFNMVRAGICVYGAYPSELLKSYVELEPAMSVHAKIIDERIIGFDQGVSYGQKFKAKSPVKICTIPIGYADGLHRSASQNISVLYKGRSFPQVGAICMDMCMFAIDFSGTFAQENYNAQVGEEVLLLGQDAQSKITLDDIAKACGTINYEIATAFRNRMPVIYK